MTISLKTTAAAMSLFLVTVPFSLQVLAQEQAGPVEAPIEIEVQAPASRLVQVTGAAQAALIKDISKALEGVETAKGRFTQYNSDFTQSSGDFYLRRPGRVRFEYDAPSPVLIIADGTTVAIEDSDLETQDRLPLRATPLAFILERNLNIEDKARIVMVQRTENVIAVTLEDKSGDVPGELSMIFGAENYDLLQWQTVDANGAATLVELSAIETGAKLNARLFRIEEQNAEDERD